MKKIFIAGASGFIGKNLLSDLIRDNKIYINRRDFKKLNKNVKDSKNLLVLNEESKKIKFDFLINCIANTNTKSLDWEVLHKSNCLTNIELLENYNYSCFVYLSSFSVFSENSIANKKPDPINTYGLSKYLSEKLVEQYCRKKSSAIILRLPLVIGKEKKQEDLISYFYKKLSNSEDITLYENGKYLRNIVHCNQVTKLINIITSQNIFINKINIYHINSSDLISVKDICYYMKVKIGSLSKIKSSNKKVHSDFDSMFLDNSRKLKGYKELPIKKNIDIFIEEYL